MFVLKLLANTSIIKMSNYKIIFIGYFMICLQFCAGTCIHPMYAHIYALSMISVDAYMCGLLYVLF